MLQFQSVPLVREKLELGRGGEKVPTHLFSDLAGIFGIHFRQISELPRLLAFVKIPLVRLLYLHHFNLDRPLRSDLDRKATEFQTHPAVSHNRRKLCACFVKRLPVAHRKQFFFFFPALQTLTMQRRRSSLGVKMSLWRACLMAVMADAVSHNTTRQPLTVVKGATSVSNPRQHTFIYTQIYRSILCPFFRTRFFILDPSGADSHD